jgi:hypothetical protein
VHRRKKERKKKQRCSEGKIKIKKDKKIKKVCKKYR